MKKVFLTVLMFLFLFSYSYSKESKRDTEIEKIKVSYAALSGSMGVFYVGNAAGVYVRNGISPEFIYIPSGALTAQALLSGDISISQMAGPAVIRAALGGADLIMIAGLENKLIHSLITVPSIKRIDELRGKRIGISRFGSSSDFALRYALKKWNLLPHRDVAVIQMGGLSERVTGLQTGSIQGAMLTVEAKLKAKKLGFVELLDFTKLEDEYQHTGLATTKSFIKNNYNTVRKFIKGYIEGIYVYRTNRELSLPALAQFLRTNDMEVVDEVYKFYSKSMEKIPFPTINGLRLVLEEISEIDKRAKTANPDDFADMRFVKEIVESGFINKLYEK